jgi:tyrosinase
MTRVRKNIDTLSASELADYEYAMRKVIEISQQNPENQDGFAYFAALHDDIDVGPCEHGRDTFLPWHRAHLWEFEDALRRSDPPRTANVTIPYWNWSERASGPRYPRAFHDQASILFKAGRNIAEFATAPYPWTFVETNVLSKETWSTGDSFGGAAIGESDCSSLGRQQFGALEGQIHNPMHGSFIGGLMGNPASAAEDPIFYSFHAFIDVVWWCWQQMPKRVSDSCLKCKLCGLYRNQNRQEPWTAGNTIDVNIAPLGYTYDFTPPSAPSQLAMHPAVPLLMERGQAVLQLKSVDIRVPDSRANRALLSLDGIANRNEITFDLLVFLSPKSEPIDPRSPDFLQNRLASHISVWQIHHGTRGSHHHGHGAPDQMHGVLDLTNAIRALSDKAAGEIWTLTVATTAATNEIPKDHKRRKLEDFHSDVATMDLVPKQVGFETMQLNIDGVVVNG